jgi:hypothetical protein
MVGRRDWVAIEMSIPEIASAQAEARRRDQAAIRAGARPRGSPEGTRRAHMLGLLGEDAVAKYFGLPPVRDSWHDDHRRGWDVGGISVRTRSQSHYGLLLRSHERTGNHVLALAHEEPHTIYLAGWIRAEDAWRHAVPGHGGGGGAWWIVDQEHLIPLPPVIRAQSDAAA